MRVEPFKSIDYVHADLLPGRGLGEWGLRAGVIAMLKYMEDSGTFWTLRDDKETVLLIGGWHRVWDGVCEVSLFPTTHFVKRPVGPLLRLKKVLNALLKGHRRVQLNCRKEDRFTQFAERLGFQVEGTLRGFGYDGSDHIMMSRLGVFNA